MNKTVRVVSVAEISQALLLCVKIHSSYISEYACVYSTFLGHDSLPLISYHIHMDVKDFPIMYAKEFTPF